MKTELLNYLKKYIYLFIFNGLLYIPFNLFITIDMETMLQFSEIRGYIDIAIKIIIAILLFFDFNKEKISFKYLAVISSLFYGLLGVIIFSLLFLEKENNDKRNVA